MEERASSLESQCSVPWLVFPYGKGKQNHALYNIFEPENNRKFIPELGRKTFWQKPSHQGWLIILCDVKDEDNSIPANWDYGDCFLWNPLTLERIQLPSLLKWITYEPDGEYMIDCVLSSPPSNDNDHPLVLVLYQPMSDLDNYTFLFCHPGEKHWRTQLFSEKINGEMCDVEYLHCFKDKLYASGINGDCIEIEEQHQVGDSHNVSLSMRVFR
ncbi:hypothetical protein MKW98_019521 [Papaver atlanticum]|uniref:KIB1-4 beta-propeller domain-containing protein n=1 Tax=Papaver atlanticum TaxID=357466 RepID=A0AAD4S8Q5_9MAGN|nr:hypothetical protein MKW98_019521 [Papaver atlanticum]